MTYSHNFGCHFVTICSVFAVTFSSAAFADDGRGTAPPTIDGHASSDVVTMTALDLNRARQSFEERSAIENPDYTVVDDGSRYAVVRTNWRSGDECSIRRERGSVNVAPCLPWEISNANPDEPSETEPTSVEVLARAVDSVSIEGAGLVVQPAEWVYLGVPTLAHAQTDTIRTRVNVLGFGVSITPTIRKKTAKPEHNDSHILGYSLYFNNQHFRFSTET